MSIQPLAAWALLVIVAAFVAAFALSEGRKYLRRRARRRYYAQLAYDSRGMPLVKAPTRPSMEPERVASISNDAQLAAWRVARLAHDKASNPYPARTREFVLWEATFHSALSDFSELSEHAEPPPKGTPTS